MNFRMNLLVKAPKQESGDQEMKSGGKPSKREEVMPTEISNGFSSLPVSETEDQMEVDEFKSVSMGFIRQTML